ncbi:MAG: family 20 glycosylhydrolase [Clostridiales bacterium]|nr:family 20 glycosylhydrolase [Clostridiales bacterium]
MPGATFRHRGFMLDVSRHYMPAEEIRKLLQAAAFLDMNRMHWHLTDDQGWRIEIRKYPLLTEVGAVRGDSFFGGTPVKERNSGFYTQEEIREIVRFAGSLGIEIIPEIEIPGHAAAMLAAYPAFGCRRNETEKWQDHVEISGGIFPSLICAGSDGAIAFLKDILDEVTELFPSDMIHIGGDEAVKYRWRRCPDCRRRIRELGLPSEDALQRWLVLEIGEYLAGKGRRTVVWNDVLEGGLLPGHFIVQQWMGGEEKTRTFMENGGSVIRSDTAYCYMDYPYGAIDVKRIREMPRIPDYAAGLEDRLLGMECPLWTERVTDLDRAAYLLFPRLTAMSLRMKGEAEELDWEAFRDLVAEKEKELEQKTGLRGAPEAEWSLSPEQAEAERDAENRKIHAPEALPFVQKQDELLRIEKEERTQKMQ